VKNASWLEAICWGVILGLAAYAVLHIVGAVA
jgi:hypothetical protein